MHVYHSVDTTSNSRQGSRNLNLKHSRWDQHARGFRADHFTHLVGLSQRRRKIREPRGENGKSPGTSGRQKREPKRWQRETRPARHGGVRWRTGPRDRSAGSPSKPERRRRGFPLRAVGKERSPADALLWARRQPPYTSVFRNRKRTGECIITCGSRSGTAAGEPSGVLRERNRLRTSKGIVIWIDGIIWKVNKNHSTDAEAE